MGAIVAATSCVGARGATAFDMLRAVAHDHPGENVVFSPLSIDLALSLLAEGASGETRREILEAMPESGSGSASRLRILVAAQGERGAVEFGSCIWAPPKIVFAPSFLRAAEVDFAATALTSDPVNAPALLNSWISRATHGLIPTILDSYPDPNGVLLANALAFFGKWMEPFSPSAERDFRGSNGRGRRATMMSRAGLFNYAATRNGEIIEIPYGDSDFSFVVFSPKSPSDLAPWIETIDDAAWAALRKSSRPTNGVLDLPRLNVSQEIDLGNTLRAFGITRAFNPAAAEFEGITASHEPLFVGKIVHRSRLKVDEEGTAAAASTIIHLPGAAPPAFHMVVDHAFGFAIMDNATETFLFLGVIEQP